jgi:hypothetical protein
MFVNNLFFKIIFLLMVFTLRCSNNKTKEINRVKMTYIIAVSTPNSILMSSDTRLNYFEDVEKDGIRYQKVMAIADCIRKTFYISSAQIGINFLGIGFFKDKDSVGVDKYPLSHFIQKLNNQRIEGNIEDRFLYIYHYFVSISEANNTRQYVNGIMAGFEKGVPYVCTFYTYDNTFESNEFQKGKSFDSEKNNNQFPQERQEIISEINRRIKQKSVEKPYFIGGDIEIMELLSDGTYEYIQKSNTIFNGTLNELLSKFNSDINIINGRIINPPVFQKYDDY